MAKCTRAVVAAVVIAFVASCGADSADVPDFLPQAGAATCPGENEPLAGEPGTPSREFLGWHRSDCTKNFDRHSSRTPPTTVPLATAQRWSTTRGS